MASLPPIDRFSYALALELDAIYPEDFRLTADCNRWMNGNLHSSIQLLSKLIAIELFSGNHNYHEYKIFIELIKLLRCHSFLIRQRPFRLFQTIEVFGELFAEQKRNGKELCISNE